MVQKIPRPHNQLYPLSMHTLLYKMQVSKVDTNYATIYPRKSNNQKEDLN